MEATTNFTKLTNLTKEQILPTFRQELEKSEDYKDSIDSLVEIYEKTPTDHFVVYRNPVDAIIAQGDVCLFAKGTPMYDKYIKSWESEGISDSKNLQFGASMTGDHCVVPLKGSDCKVEKGTIRVQVGSREVTYDVKRVKSNKPFLVTHKEHGNIAVPANDYLACVQMNEKNLERVMD
jgi:hypothetical protein